MIRIKIIVIACFLAVSVNAQVKYPNILSSFDENNLSNQLSNEFMPVIGVWVWNQEDLKPNGYKNSIDQLSKNSPFNLIVPFLRFPDKEVTDDEIFQQVKLATEYAVKNNIGLLPDLDVRSARRAFNKKYPGEQQEMLRLNEIALSKNKEVETLITSIKDLNDHYSGGNIPKYNSIKSSIQRVYAYKKTKEGIDANSIQDITQECTVLVLSNDSVKIKFPVISKNGATHACTMISFTLFYPDIFGPHLIEFQREILNQYAELPLSGACKDEWGFPPYYPRFYTERSYDFWYSKHRAAKYAERTGGKELLVDCLLMAFEVKGKKLERQVAINHFREMSFERNVEIEDDFYQTVKNLWGDDAAVTVHSTWWPYPDFNEFKKNGLDWWASKRDWAQTDELTPFGVRTALCKKWGSPVWYNMYYTANLPDQVWGSALAGGRINYLRFYSLFDKEIMRAESRIRLLNYISKSPLDCQVAVIFGHTAAMNWADSNFNDVGMELVDTLWNHGYPTDLIPSSEIENGSLKVDEDGFIYYGTQKYSAVVLYHPEFEKESTSTFFNLASNGKTALFKIGDWTHNFVGLSVNGDELLPKDMVEVEDYQMAFLSVLEVLKKNNISKQTPATAVLDTTYFKLRGYEHTSYFPPNTGFSKLIDGTHIMVAGTNTISGDPIQSDFTINGFDVSVDAIGVVGVRLNDDGSLNALVASDLKYFKINNLAIELEKRLDIALWKNKAGKYEGIIQAEKFEIIPEALLQITNKWSFLHLPVPPKINTN